MRRKVCDFYNYDRRFGIVLKTWYVTGVQYEILLYRHSPRHLCLGICAVSIAIERRSRAASFWTSWNKLIMNLIESVRDGRSTKSTDAKSCVGVYDSQSS